MAESDEITTTMIVNQEMVDTIIIAMADCVDACNNRINHADKIINNAPIGPAPKKLRDAWEIKALSEFTLAQIPKVLAEIKEIYPELEKRVETKNNIIIEKPNWGNKNGEFKP